MAVRTNAVKRSSGSSLLRVLLLGAVLAAGLLGGYGLIGARAGQERRSAHQVSARATNASAAVYPDSTATPLVARTPVTDPASLAALQTEMEQLERRMVALTMQAESSTTTSTASAELRPLIAASEAALLQLDALIVQQALPVVSSGLTASGMDRPREMGGGPMGVVGSDGGLHGHH